MKLHNLLLIAFISIIIPGMLYAGTAYYVKNGGNNNNTGLSDAQAWADMANIDGQDFEDGTDIYFKQGHIWTISNDVDINFSGVDSADRSIIGCYTDTGDFDCSGARPIIQSNNNNVGIFYSSDPEYMTFKYLDIRNIDPDWEDCLPGGNGSSAGINFKGTDYTKGHNIVTDCKFFQIGHYAIALQKLGNYNIVTNNVFDYTGNAIYFIDESSGVGSDYNYVAGNTCTNTVGYATCGNPTLKVDGHCVGLQRTSYTIVENNTSSDSRGVYVVWTNATGPLISNIFRHNVSYGSDSSAIIVAGGSDPARYGDENSTNNLVYNNVATYAGKTEYRPCINLSNLQPTTGRNSVFNNTVYMSYGKSLEIRYGSDYSRFVNNIAVGDGWNTGGVPSPTQARDDYLFSFNGVNTFGGTRSTFTIDYNLYWNDLGDPTLKGIWRDITSDDYAWSGWTDNARTWDQNGFVDNPDFVDASNNDFTPQSGSPAIDAGKYLSYVTNASGTTITVADTYWFHGNFGITDAEGNAVTGMLISFYDETNGLQNRTITSNNINHGMPGTFEINNGISYIYDANNPTDPVHTTQVSLRFSGTAPDIGATVTVNGDTVPPAKPTGLDIVE